MTLLDITKNFEKNGNVFFSVLLTCYTNSCHYDCSDLAALHQKKDAYIVRAGIFSTKLRT